MENLKITNRELCRIILLSHLKTTDVLLTYLEEKYSPSKELKKAIDAKLSRYFMPYFNRKWKQVLPVKENREEKFLEQNKEWLDTEFSVSLDSSSSTIRKSKSFEDCSAKTKKRRVDAFKESILMDDVELLDSLQILDEKTAKNIVKQALESDNSAQQLNSTQTDNTAISFTNNEALAMFVDLNLTKRKYELLRKLLKEKNANILPPYKDITKAKTECYPPASEIKIDEIGASINLQGLLNHTVHRLLMVENVNIPVSVKKVKMTSKYGGDGTSGFNPYKQKFENSENSDANLFLMSLVPLRLECSSGSNQIIWENKRPCSPRNCLPIMFQFAKETKSKILNEFGNIEQQIKKLKPTKFEINGIIYYVEHELLGTMIDGKVCQHLTGTLSAANCTICGAKPSQMNKLTEILERTEDQRMYKFGVQVLHSWIRIMENVLNVSYRLTLKIWACRKEEEKLISAERKAFIKKEIREKLGLTVDTPKEGSGTTNDGNTARKFFENYEMISNITGFDKELLKNLYVVLQVLASGQAVCSKKFQEYTLRTAELYVDKYPWYYMPASMHKLLIHGAKIIDSFVIPIGQLSEESQEAKNKDFKNCRENNTRKTSRIDTNTDLLHYLLFSADLFISSLRTEYTKPQKELLPEAKKLLLEFCGCDVHLRI